MSDFEMSPDDCFVMRVVELERLPGAKRAVAASFGGGGGGGGGVASMKKELSLLSGDLVGVFGVTGGLDVFHVCPALDLGSGKRGAALRPSEREKLATEACFDDRTENLCSR